MQGAYDALALADFEAEDAAELSFSKGQVLMVLQGVTAPEGWLIARSGGQEGLIPETFVRAQAAGGAQLNHSSAAASGGAFGMPTLVSPEIRVEAMSAAVALASFDAEDASEVPLHDHHGLLGCSSCPARTFVAPTPIPVTKV